LGIQIGERVDVRDMMSKFLTTIALMAAIIMGSALPARAGVGTPEVSPIFGSDRNIYRAAITTTNQKPTISFYGKLFDTSLEELRQITVDDLGDVSNRDVGDLEGKKLLIHLVVTMNVGPTTLSVNSPFLTSRCEELSITEGAYRCSLDLTEISGNNDFENVEGLSAQGVRNMFEARDKGSPRFRFAIKTADGDSTWNMSLITLLDASSDEDGDGVPSSYDNCPSTPNFDQIDSDIDGTGDECEEHATLPESGVDGGNNSSENTWAPQDMGFNSSGSCSMIPVSTSTPSVTPALLLISCIPLLVFRRKSAR
jgi:hypothetical protein